MYRLYTRVNAADTWRDPDDIHTTELGYVNTKEEAASYMRKYIGEKFFSKDSKVCEDGDKLRAYEFCSYGRTLCADLMKKSI